MRIRLVIALAVLAQLGAAGCAPSLAVAPQLVAAWPLAGASLPVKAHMLSLTFNRPLQADATWAAVWHDDDGALLSTDVAIASDNPRRLLIKLLEPTAGAYRLHWHVAAARTSATSDGESEFALRDEAAAAPHLDVADLVVDSGERIEIDGNGFTPRADVGLTIGDDDQQLTTVRSDARGSFSTEVHVPVGLPFGEQRVSAVDGSGGSAEAALQVRWGGWPPVVAFTVGQPGPDTGEVTFSLSARNRSDYVLESVRVILNEPAGATFVAAEPMPVRQDLSLVWDVPTLDRGVVGPFRATYRVSSAVATHARIEFRHRRPRGCSGDECLTAFVSETLSDSAPVSPAR